jgi:ABC-2 type transport system ATP-binding protein
MADRVGVMHKGELLVVEEKRALMRKLGKKHLTLHLLTPLKEVPVGLASWPLKLGNSGTELEYTFEEKDEGTGVPALLGRLSELGIAFKDLNTRQTSLEDIFIDLVNQP